ncbi:MAG: hypothetical protein AAB654_23955, partial [Acidobacteriota bacterium]
MLFISFCFSLKTDETSSLHQPWGGRAGDEARRPRQYSFPLPAFAVLLEVDSLLDSRGSGGRLPLVI